MKGYDLSYYSHDFTEKEESIKAIFISRIQELNPISFISIGEINFDTVKNTRKEFKEYPYESFQQLPLYLLEYKFTIPSSKISYFQNANFISLQLNSNSALEVRVYFIKSSKILVADDVIDMVPSKTENKKFHDFKVKGLRSPSQILIPFYYLGANEFGMIAKEYLTRYVKDGNLSLTDPVSQYIDTANSVFEFRSHASLNFSEKDLDCLLNKILNSNHKTGNFLMDVLILLAFFPVEHKIQNDFKFQILLENIIKFDLFNTFLCRNYSKGIDKLHCLQLKGLFYILTWGCFYEKVKLSELFKSKTNFIFVIIFFRMMESNFKIIKADFPEGIAFSLVDKVSEYELINLLTYSNSIKEFF